MSAAVEESKKGSIGKSISKASQMMIGVGPPLYKQLKFAILEGNEEKAIGIYNGKEMGKALKDTLHPSKPFPSKKDPNGETPLHLSAKYALPVLFGMFLQFGGRPDIVNSRRESCAHTACTESNHPARRAEIVEQALKWRSVNPSTNKAVAVAIDGGDLEGNTAMHLAAYNGLLLILEKLIAYRASSYVLNHNNLTAPEHADVSGRANIGTMIELAALFAPSLNGGRVSDAIGRYKTILREYRSSGLGVLVLDSHSLTASGLMKFINRTIAMVAEALKETPARAEVMLMHYRWDARQLIADYQRSPGSVARAVRIQSRGQGRGTEADNSQALVVKNDTETAVVLHDIEVNLPVGIPISDVFVDSSYLDMGPFAVMRGGKKVPYTIRSVQGKTVVVPFDFDPAAKGSTIDDQKVSANSHLKPEATSACPMCGEQMLEAAAVQHFIADTLVQPKHRELQCGSGHKYCFSCWAGYLQAQAASREGLHALQCPGQDCGETLDLQWAPVLLKSPDLVNRVLAQRQRQVTDKLKLHWCSVPKCGLVVHVHATEDEESRGSDCSAGSIPLCGLCANGHGVCLCCGSEPHAPCKCDELTKWQDLVGEVARTPQAKERANPAHILQHAPHHKNCTQCGASNGKEHGSNHIRCTGCFREFCWICQRDWAAHSADSKVLQVSDNGDEEVPFQCNTWVDPLQPSGLSDRHAIFLRYFARYQAHMESFNLESAMFKGCVDRVVQGLKASHDGELQWLLGESVFNPYDPADSVRVLNDKDVTLADSYLPREKAVEFLVEAFEELEKCRTLLRWSYPFAMFQFEEEFRKAFGPNGMVLILGDRSEYRGEFLAAQNVLERQTEFLSDLLAHRRLRGSRDDIIEACLVAKSHRAVLESLIVRHNPTFGGSQSLDFSRSQSVDDRRSSLRGVDISPKAGAVKMMVAAGEEEGQSVVHTSAQAKSSAGVTSATAGTVKSSFSTAMEIDLGRQQAQARPASASMAAPPPVMQAPSTPKQQPPAKAPIIEEPESESEEEYGYNSGDEEGLQVCTDVAMMKIDASPQRPLPGSGSGTGAQQKTTTTTGKLTIDAERSTQQATEMVTTVRTTKVMSMQSAALSGMTNTGSGNSLISDLTTPDFNNSGSSLMFARVPKLTAETSPKPPQLIQQATNNTAASRGLVKTSSMTSKQLSKQVSKLFVKQIVEHISEEESKIVYQLMSKHKITREKAVRMFLEEHDERLYNPKAVYLFPGEEYTPEEEDDDDSEEERRKQAMFGRVEYNQKTRVDTDSISEASPATIEQRLIGVKKDPDQEALEHALLLSAQEQEFGVNMYDSLTAADQLVLHEYISQGFTREEGALIIFEEKFGKTKNTQNSVVIPAMPTLRAVHASTHSHTGTDRSSAAYGSDEEDGEEVEDLIRRGYTREQAIAVIEGHREKARRAAATQHPSDPTFYHPHPNEDRFNLSEREEREVEQVMSRQQCSRRVAVETVVQMRTTASSASVTSHNSHTSWEGSNSSNYSESAEVRKYMDRGYSREQALQLIRNKTANAATASSTNSVSSRRPSHSSTTGDSYSEETEITKYMNRGYTQEQAKELVRRSRESSQRTSITLHVEAPAIADTAPRHRRSASGSNSAAMAHFGAMPANMDAETTELVRQQNEDYGTNMFISITREDDAEVERLMAEGYQYNEALLEIFNYTHPPRPMGRQYTGYPQVPAGQSFYQQQPPQYQVAPPQQPYYAQQPAGYMHSQSYYVPPQPQQVPVTHTQSFYQVPGPSYMVHPNGQMQQIPATDEELYPTQYAPGAKPASLSRKPSSRESGSNGKPPVINGNQTLLEQKREKAAKAAREKEREKEQESQEVKDNTLRKKSSFFGGISGATRKSAHTEDDLMARAHHMSDVDHGRKDATDKGRVPKLKYNEADVNKVMKMGFTRDQAVQALVQSHNNVDEAVHMLTDNLS